MKIVKSVFSLHPTAHAAVPTARFKDTKTLEDKIIKLEKANNALQVVYEESVLDAEDAHKNISTLEKELKIMRTKLEDKICHFQVSKN